MIDEGLFSFKAWKMPSLNALFTICVSVFREIMWKNTTNDRWYDRELNMLFDYCTYTWYEICYIKDSSQLRFSRDIRDYVTYVRLVTT